jgi:hypothetical protein
LISAPRLPAPSRDAETPGVTSCSSRLEKNGSQPTTNAPVCSWTSFQTTFISLGVLLLSGNRACFLDGPRVRIRLPPAGSPVRT